MPGRDMRHQDIITLLQLKKKMKIKNLGKQKKLRKDVPYFLMTYLSYRSFEDAHIIYYSIFSCLPCTGSRPTALPWSPSAVLRSPGCWTRFDCRPLTGRFARGIPPPSCHMIWPADRWWPAAVSPWWWEGGEGEKRGVSISVVFNWVSGYMGIPLSLLLLQQTCRINSRVIQGRFPRHIICNHFPLFLNMLFISSFYLSKAFLLIILSVIFFF